MYLIKLISVVINTFSYKAKMSVSILYLSLYKSKKHPKGCLNFSESEGLKMVSLAIPKSSLAYSTSFLSSLSSLESKKTGNAQTYTPLKVCRLS